MFVLNLQKKKKKALLLLALNAYAFKIRVWGFFSSNTKPVNNA